MSSIPLIQEPTQDSSSAVLAKKLADVQAQLALMAHAVVNIAVAAKITHATMPLTGPQILQLATDVTRWIRAERCNVSRSRCRSHSA
jgi:hypothetical protein